MQNGRTGLEPDTSGGKQNRNEMFQFIKECGVLISIKTISIICKIKKLPDPRYFYILEALKTEFSL